MDSRHSAFPALPHSGSPAPRSVANLAFPEILVIWALRRYTGSGRSRETRTATIAAEFSRAFGLARLEGTLAAFACVADSLAGAARLPQALSVLEDDRINATEEALLATLAALQQGAAARAAALSEWNLLPAGRAAFLAGAQTLARDLREAGHLLPYQAPQGAAPALAGGLADSPPLTSASGTAELRPAEQGLVTGMRLWVAAFKRQEDALGAARAHFDRQFNNSGALWGDRRNGDDAGLSLHAVLRNTTLAARRPVDVRCPACGGLSPDEARLVDAAAWLQRGVAQPAAAALGDWLPPAALRLTLSPARGLAQALLAAEQALPLRRWDFAALAAAAEPAPADARPQPARSTGAPTLH